MVRTTKSNISSKLKLIAVDIKNYEALKNEGRASESFNDVITELLKRNKESKIIRIRSSKADHDF